MKPTTMLKKPVVSPTPQSQPNEPSADQQVEANKVKHISKPPATLLMGPPGSGKTTAIATYLKAGLEVFVIITDPGGEEALLDACIRQGLPMDKLHWRYISATAHSWSVAENILNRVNTMSYESLGGLKMGLEKNSYKQFIEVMTTLRNFVDDRTGENYGAVDTWGSDRVLVIDSLTGINKMAKRLVIGAKPTLHQGEWGTAMEIEEQFLDLLVGNTKCFLCCIAHIERERDEVTGGVSLMVSLLGSKLAPRIPYLFSDVILSKREGANFFWSTTENNVALKARTLPLKNDLQPTFEQIVSGWKTREEAITQSLGVDESSTSNEANGN